MYVPKKKLIWATYKSYRFHGNLPYVLNGDSTQSKFGISQPVINIDWQSWYHIKAKTFPFYFLFIYLNKLICIFINFHLNVFLVKSRKPSKFKFIYT